MLYANRDDFFIRYDEQFRNYPSEEKDEVMEDLLSIPDIAQEWEAYQDSMDTRADFFTKGTPTNSSLQWSVVARCQRRTSYRLSFWSESSSSLGTA